MIQIDPMATVRNAHRRAERRRRVHRRSVHRRSVHRRRVHRRSELHRPMPKRVNWTKPRVLRRPKESVALRVVDPTASRVRRVARSVNQAHLARAAQVEIAHPMAKNQAIRPPAGKRNVAVAALLAAEVLAVRKVAVVSVASCQSSSTWSRPAMSRRHRRSGHAWPSVWKRLES